MRVVSISSRLAFSFSVLLACCFTVLVSTVQALPSTSQSLQVGDTSLPMWARNDRTGALKGSVLLILGAGSAGAWPHSLSALADTLPDHGWNTVAIRADVDMPNMIDFEKRVNAALDGLKTQAGGTIVLVASDALAGSVALQSINKTFSKPPTALVFLNRPVLEEADNEIKFHQQNLAVLDLYRSLPASAPLWRERRNLAAEHKHTLYKQIRLPPTGPNWTGQADRVVKKVAGWLKRRYQ